MRRRLQHCANATQSSWPSLPSVKNFGSSGKKIGSERWPTCHPMPRQSSTALRIPKCESSFRLLFDSFLITTVVVLLSKSRSLGDGQSLFLRCKFKYFAIDGLWHRHALSLSFLTTN